MYSILLFKTQHTHILYPWICWHCAHKETKKSCCRTVLLTADINVWRTHCVDNEMPYFKSVYVSLKYFCLLTTYSTNDEAWKGYCSTYIRELNAYQIFFIYTYLIQF